MLKPSLSKLSKKVKPTSSNQQVKISEYFKSQMKCKEKSKSEHELVREQETACSSRNISNTRHKNTYEAEGCSFASVKKHKVNDETLLQFTNEDKKKSSSLSCATVNKIRQFSVKSAQIISNLEDKEMVVVSENFVEKQLNNSSSQSAVDLQAFRKHKPTDESFNMDATTETKKKYTPLELQVLELKRENPGMILLIQNAYKYHFFGEDAEIASCVLNVASFWSHNFLTAVIPVVRLHAHIGRLVEKGYRVGVVNQTETSALKAAGDNRNTPFSRKLAHVYTKATLIGDDVDPLSQVGQLTDGSNVSKFILCISEIIGETHTIGLVALDPSTGEAFYDSFEDSPSRAELEHRFEHLKPTEVLVSDTVSQETDRLLKYSSAQVEKLSAELFDFTSTLARVVVFFSEQCQSNHTTFEGVTELPPLTVTCLGVVLQHLKQFGLEHSLQYRGLKAFTSDKYHLQLDAAAVRNLEIFSSSAGTFKGSLCWALDHSKTKFGARLLRRWISQPLCDLSLVTKRQEMVTELVTSDSSVIGQLREFLTDLPDLERGLTTILHSRSSPSSLYTVIQTLSRIQTEFESMLLRASSELQSETLRSLIQETSHCVKNVGLFMKNINATTAKEDNKTHFLNDYSEFPEVVKLFEEMDEVNESLTNMKKEIAKRLGRFRFEYTSVAGHEFLVEVKVNDTVPNSWRKVSSTKQLTRYRPPEVDVLFSRLSQLREKLSAACEAAYQDFVIQFNEHYFSHKHAVHNLATVDVLFSLAEVSKQEGYCRPTLLNSEEVWIDIERGRHPVVPLLFPSADQFVANNTQLKNTGQSCMVISGPNMGGKSCYLRQVALITIMAHLGSYVPANRATISLLDAIYTRMGARDDLFKHRSTLLLELEEASAVLRQATSRSLVLMDELGRGTSSCDGAAIAAATLHQLVTQVCCPALFVTHYPSVMQLAEQLKPAAANYHMGFLLQEDEGDNLLIFLYQVTPGPASKSYGLNVARLADIPASILQRAAQAAQQLDSKCGMVERFKQLWFCESPSKFKKTLKLFDQS